LADHALLSHFNSFFKRKERKRGREALLLLLAENPLEEKPPYLLSFKLHSIKKGIALVKAYIPNF
jgi:hypothetical protein